MSQRVSRHKKGLTGLDKIERRNEIILQMFNKELTQGQALKLLRVEVLGIDQLRFIKLVNLSRQTLSNLENDKGNYSIAIINQAFRPFGLELGIVPIVRDVLSEMIKQGRVII